MSWKRWLGSAFNAVAAVCLRDGRRSVERIPCENGCACNHRVRPRGTTLVGVCDCGEECEDVPLAAADVKVLKLNLDSLGRAVTKALGCRAVLTPTGFHRTIQVAALGNPAVPVVLTIQPNADGYHNAVAHLAAKLPKGFILLTPTKLTDAATLELVTRANVGFYDLESNLVVTESGILSSTKTAEALFAAHLPEKQAAFKKSDVLRVFAILQKLKSKRAGISAPLFDVFMAVVVGRMLYRPAATKCGCSVGTLSTRIRELEGEFGMTIKQLQAYAGPLLEMERAVKGQRTAKKKQGAPKDEPEQYPETTDGENEDGYLPEERQNED